jgi:hypothetical protein
VDEETVLGVSGGRVARGPAVAADCLRVRRAWSSDATLGARDVRINSPGLVGDVVVTPHFMLTPIVIMYLFST